MRGLETLEGRRLFSFTTSTESFGGSSIFLNVAVNGAVSVQETAANTFVVSDPAGGQADETFTGVEGLTITGGSGADEIRLSAFDGTLFATIDAGVGDDRVYVTDNFRVLFGFDRPAGFEVHGGNGRDYLEVTRGSRTTLYGENGDDVFVVLDGSATVSGGNGDDTTYAADGTSVSLDGGRGSNTFYDGATPPAP